MVVTKSNCDTSEQKQTLHITAVTNKIISSLAHWCKYKPHWCKPHWLTGNLIGVNNYTKQKHLGCKKGEANQKQQLSDYKSIHSYTCD